MINIYNNHLKRFGIIILLCSMLLSMLILGCAEDKETDSQTESKTETTAEPIISEQPKKERDILAELPEADFNEKTFSIIGIDYAERRNFSNEENTGEIVNDALVERDLAVEEMYNVKINCIPKPDRGKVTSAVSKNVMADDTPYNMVICSIGETLVSLMQKKSLLDMRTIPHIKLDENWWSAGMYENASYKGRQYITYGDISPQKYYAPFCLAYNKRLAQDYQLGDIYKDVLDGKWTHDKFAGITKDLNRDLNGDSKFDENDFYGYAYLATAVTAHAHYTAAGQKLSESGPNGEIEINIASEASVKVIEKLASYFKGIKDVALEKQSGIFKDGRALFMGNSYSIIISDLRDMKDDFGVIPTPKLDEEQEKYFSFMNIWCLGSEAVPINCDDMELTGIVSEALCRTSYMILRPALYEKTMKVKVARDDESVKMLDIIFDNTYVDYNSMMNFGKSGDVVSNAIFGKKDFVSGYAKIEDKISKDIEKFLENEI